MEIATVYSIGHSTMPVQKLIDILKAHSVTLLVDIRRIPKSGHNPQFNSDSLESSLKRAGLGYINLKQLGGLRRPSKNSENTGWRNPSFKAGLDRLIALSKKNTTAMMCAEGNPFRCHRSLVADALTVRGIRAIDISSTRPGRLHSLTPFARVAGESIRYVE
jgi:uncharacterized protein (DUF488 family)